MLLRSQLVVLLLLLSCQLCLTLNVWLWVISRLKQLLLPTLPSDPEDVVEEAGLTTAEFIEQAGYFAETFTTETRDGYILTLYRIPHGKTNTKKDGRIPVIIIPGFGCSSAMFVDRDQTSAGFVLAESGFDVWLGNLRGSVYSRAHVSLDADASNFWDFTMDDHANYDMPAIIDFVLHETECGHVQLVTHSMGGAVSLMMLAAKPEYNKKVKGAVHLGPGVFMKYITTLYRPVINASPIGERLFEALGIRELFRNTPLSRTLLFSLCPTQDPFICETFFYSFIGYKPKLNRNRITFYINHCPTGISSLLMFQYGQIHQTNRISYYNYGNARLNMLKYGQREPPLYDLKKITAPMAIFYSKNDPLGDPLDMALLIRELNSSVYNYLIPAPYFTHVDFMWGDEAEKLVFVPLIETLHKMWKGPDP